MKTKNLPEFKALIKRYESITLEEIKELGVFINYFTAQKLTGFGDPDLCTLCLACKNKCTNCVYTSAGCMLSRNALTFNKIHDADTPTKLLNAFRARAKHMKTILKKC